MNRAFAGQIPARFAGIAVAGDRPAHDFARVPPTSINHLGLATKMEADILRRVETHETIEVHAGTVNSNRLELEEGGRMAVAAGTHPSGVAALTGAPCAVGGRR